MTFVTSKPITAIFLLLCLGATVVQAGVPILGSEVNLGEEGAGVPPGPVGVLIQAAAAGDTGKMAKILAGGVDINQETQYGETALMYAARYGKPKAVEWLLDRRADPNIQTKDGKNTALVFASCFSGPSVVRLLLDHGANPNLLTNARNGLGNPPALGTAITAGKIENVRLLLAHGAKLRNSLEHAIAFNRPDIVKLLLVHGATVRRNISRLLYAKKIASPEIRKLLHLDRYALLGKNDAIYPDSLDELAQDDGIVHRLYTDPNLLLDDYPGRGHMETTFTYLEGKVVKNVIFARHDYAFDTVWLRNYFTRNFPSYRPETKSIVLTTVDKKNLAYVKYLETQTRDRK